MLFLIKFLINDFEIIINFLINNINSFIKYNEFQ